MIPMHDDPSISPLELKPFTCEAQTRAAVEIVRELPESGFLRWQN